MLQAWRNTSAMPAVSGGLFGLVSDRECRNRRARAARFDSRIGTRNGFAQRLVPADLSAGIEPVSDPVAGVASHSSRTGRGIVRKRARFAVPTTSATRSAVVQVLSTLDGRVVSRITRSATSFAMTLSARRRCSSIALSWRRSWGVAFSPVRISTTRTGSAMTTVQRTSSSGSRSSRMVNASKSSSTARPAPASTVPR